MSTSEGLRHATAWALNHIYQWDRDEGLDSCARQACDWDWTTHGNNFVFEDAVKLVNGRKVRLPTCPACAALLDLALEMRGAS